MNRDHILPENVREALDEVLSYAANETDADDEIQNAIRLIDEWLNSP